MSALPTDLRGPIGVLAQIGSWLFDLSSSVFKQSKSHGATQQLWLCSSIFAITSYVFLPWQTLTFTALLTLFQQGSTIESL